MSVEPCSVEHSDILAEAVAIPLESWNIHTFVVTDCFPGVDLQCLCFGLVSNAAVFGGESDRAVFSIECLLTRWTIRNMRNLGET